MRHNLYLGLLWAMLASLMSQWSEAEFTPPSSFHNSAWFVAQGHLFFAGILSALGLASYSSHFEPACLYFISYIKPLTSWLWPASLSLLISGFLGWDLTQSKPEMILTFVFLSFWMHFSKQLFQGTCPLSYRQEASTS